MEENRSNELLLGTKEVDAGLAWLGKNVKKAGEWYKDASADQEGSGDDIHDYDRSIKDLISNYDWHDDGYLPQPFN